MHSNKYFTSTIIIISGRDKIVLLVQESRVKILLDLGYIYQNC